MLLSPTDYIASLTADSERFGAVLADIDPTTRVPTCPDWDADDLLWHLAEVQWFWATIVGRRMSSPEGIDDLRPGRPTSHADLLAFFNEQSARLSDALAAGEPETSVWTWSDDHTIGFVQRRQAHEALIHRVDAELTAGSRTPMDPALSADGVDEVMRVMYGGDPGSGTFAADRGQTVRLTATEAGSTWVATLGRYTSTDDEGKEREYGDLRVAETDDGAPTAASIAGAAADLNCWLWHRPALGELGRSGNPDVLAAFEVTIADGID